MGHMVFKFAYTAAGLTILITQEPKNDLMPAALPSLTSKQNYGIIII